MNLSCVREEAVVGRLREFLRPFSQRLHEPIGDALVGFTGKAEAFVAMRGPAHVDGPTAVRESRGARVVGPRRRAAGPRFDPVRVGRETRRLLEGEHRCAVEAQIRAELKEAAGDTVPLARGLRHDAATSPALR